MSIHYRNTHQQSVSMANERRKGETTQSSVNIGIRDGNPYFIILVLKEQSTTEKADTFISDLQ